MCLFLLIPTIFLEHRVIEDIIRIAAQNNIEIYWARDDRDVDRQAIEEKLPHMAHSYSYQFPLNPSPNFE